MAAVELLLAHLFVGNTAGFIFQSLFLASLMLLKNHKLFVGLFVWIYLSLNFWVNLTDFIYTGLIKEYYHDEFFATSFSYKMHQLCLCGILAYVTAQLMMPSPKMQDNPMKLSMTFTASVGVSASLMFTFIQELTWYTASKRLKIYKTEIAKVLMTIVYFNLFTLLLMSWMW
jgi:hypothetical protein